MDTEKALEVQLQEEQAVGRLIVRKGAHPLEKCAAAAAAGLVLSACAGAPAKPPQRECPREALAAMWEVGGVGEESTEMVLLDVNQPGWFSDLGLYRDGPIVSVLEKSLGKMPKGTLMYGRLWTRGKLIIGHYDRAKLPTGEVFPVCFALGQDVRETGYPPLYGYSSNGAVKLPRVLPIVGVRRFEAE